MPIIDTERYARLRRAGHGPSFVMAAMLRDGVGPAMAIKILREQFEMSLLEAKDAWVKAERRAPSLDEYQAKLLPSVLDALEADEEKKGRG